MIILSQDGYSVLETQKYGTYSVSRNGEIFAINSTDSRKLSTYTDSKTARYAVEIFAAALADGERMFCFPKEEEVKQRMALEHSGQARINVKTKANRHGGS